MKFFQRTQNQPHSPPQPQHPWWTIRIIHKTQPRYMNAQDIIDCIESVRHTCNTDEYLECVVEYSNVSALTREFARITGAPELANPETFESIMNEKKSDTSNKK